MLHPIYTLPGKEITGVGVFRPNPSFCVINALLSRASVFTFHPLTEAEVEGLLARAIEDEKKGVGGVSLTFMPEALKMIASHAQGDARRALDLLEASVNYAHQNKIDTLTTNIVETTLCSKMPLYDKDGEGHYNIIGAFIKSMRGSDPDAAIYYMMRMLDAGEDPLFILRRMIIFASEDIGNADTHALPLAVAADTAFQRVGMPEGIYPLAHCCLYLAT